MKLVLSIPFSIVLLPLIALANPSLTKDPAKEKTDPLNITVGIVLPLSGDMSSIGVEMRRGIELALSEPGAKGVTAIFEDDQSFNKVQTVHAARKLISSDKSNIILSAAVNTARTLAPILKQSNVPGIVIWDHTRALATFSDNLYSIGFSTEAAGIDMAVFAVKELALKRVAVISADDEWSELIAAAFRTKFSNRGGTITLHERVKHDENDLRSILLKAKQKKSQAIYLPLNPPVVQSAIRQAREIGFTGELLAADGFGENEISELGEHAEGLYVTQLWLDNKSLTGRYKEKFGRELSPVNLTFVALGYDALKLTIHLRDILQTGRMPVNSTTVAKLLKQMTFKGITGMCDFRKGKATPKREPVLTVRNGVFAALNQSGQ